MLALEPDTLDPRHAVDVVGLRLSRLLHAGLVRFDPRSLEIRPGLAKSWEWTSPTELTVRLRDDADSILWSNGTHFSSVDVVETFRALLDPALHCRVSRSFETLRNVKSESDGTIRFSLHNANASFLTALEFPILRADQAKAHPDNEGRVLDGLGPYARHPDTTSVRLMKRNSALWDHRTESIEFRAVRDETARSLRLLANESDFSQNGFSPTLLPLFRERSEIRIQTVTGANTTYLLFRTDKPPFDHRRARKEVADSIQKEVLVRGIFQGTATVARSLVPLRHWAYPDDTAFEKSQMHVPEREHGTLSPAFSFSLLTSTERTRQLVAKAIRDELAPMKIAVRPMALELGTMIQRMSRGDFEAAILQFPEFYDPSLLRVFLYSDMVPPLGNNRGAVHDPRIDKALDAIDSRLDQEGRRQAVLDLERVNAEEAYMVPLWHEANVVVARGQASGIPPSGDGRFSGFALWK